MRIPVRTLKAARRAKLSLPLACSILMQESGGGLNEFGHDPTIYIGAGVVTKQKYLAYRAERDKTGQAQGVGPCQLTLPAFQNRADQLGGCWDPLCNMVEGFTSLAGNIRRDGLRPAVVGYNGSGPAAEHYADVVLARAQGYAARLHLPAP